MHLPSSPRQTPISIDSWPPSPRSRQTPKPQTFTRTGTVHGRVADTRGLGLHRYPSRQYRAGSQDPAGRGRTSTRRRTELPIDQSDRSDRPGQRGLDAGRERAVAGQFRRAGRPARLHAPGRQQYRRSPWRHHHWRPPQRRHARWFRRVEPHLVRRLLGLVRRLIRRRLPGRRRAVLAPTPPANATVSTVSACCGQREQLGTGNIRHKNVHVHVRAPGTRTWTCTFSVGRAHRPAVRRREPKLLQTYQAQLEPTALSVCAMFLPAA